MAIRHAPCRSRPTAPGGLGSGDDDLPFPDFEVDLVCQSHLIDEQFREPNAPRVADLDELGFHAFTSAT
jgi:hypothetical protein